MSMRRGWTITLAAVGLGLIGVVAGALGVQAQGASTRDDPFKSSYLSVNEENFRAVFTRNERGEAAGAELSLRPQWRPAAGVTMSRGKAIQEGVRIKLSPGANWEALARMTPDEIREKGLYPAGFMPLPHPTHPEVGMVFPMF